MSLLAQPTTKIIPAVFKLLRLRWQININSFRHAKAKTRLLTVIGLLGLLALAAFIFWVSLLLLGFLRSPQLVEYVGADVSPFLQAVPALILSGMFVGILLTSFGVLLQALYLSGDMDFLLTSPLPIRAVFIAKLLQAVLPNFSLMALFGLPVLYGLGASAGYSLLYYPLVPLMMSVLTLAAAGVSALLVMTIVKIFPARRVAEVLGFCGAIFSMICSQSGNLTNSMRHSSDPASGQLGGLLNLAQRFNTPWLPLNWAGRGLVELGEGRWVAGLALVGLTLGLAAAIFWFALLTSERWYYTGWAGMQVIATKKKVPRMEQPLRVAAPVAARKPGLAAGLIERIFPAPVRGLVQRDFLILTRDLRHMSQLVSPLIFGLLYSFMLLTGGGEPASGRGSAPPWLVDSLRSLVVYGNVGMSLLVGWMLLGQLAGNGLSREGKNFWILKASPLRGEHLLAAKFIVAYLPALGLGWFFLTGISILQGISLAGYLYGLVIVAMCLAGMNGIQLGFGALNANFTWEDPRKINSGQMGCLGSILTGLFLPLAFGTFIGPLWIAVAFQQPLAIGYLLGLVLGVSLTGICAWLPLKMARGRLAKLGES